MLKALAILIGVMVAFITFSLYCCLRAASREDEWMEAHSPGGEMAGSGETKAGRRYGG